MQNFPLFARVSTVYVRAAAAAVAATTVKCIIHFTISLSLFSASFVIQQCECVYGDSVNFSPIRTVNGAYGIN